MKIARSELTYFIGCNKLGNNSDPHVAIQRMYDHEFGDKAGSIQSKLTTPNEEYLISELQGRFFSNTDCNPRSGIPIVVFCGENIYVFYHFEQYVGMHLNRGFDL